MITLGVALLLAAVVEAVVEILGQHVPSAIKPYFAALISVAICVLYRADMLAILGLYPSVPFVGETLTGILASRGAGWLNSLIPQLLLLLQQFVGSVRGSNAS